MASHFHEKRFPRIRRDVITIVPIQNCDDFVLYIIFSLFIKSASQIFLLYMYGEMRTAFGCSQSNCHDILLYVLQPRCFPFTTHTILLMFYASCKNPLFSTCQYIFHCTSNLTDILLVDYLVVVWVCYFLTKNLLQNFFPP